MFSLPSFSHFFTLFMDVPLLLAHLPIFTHYIPMLSHSPQPLDDPSLPCPCLPPLPPFSLFLHQLCMFPCYQLPPPPFPIVCHCFTILPTPFDICFDNISLLPSQPS